MREAIGLASYYGRAAVDLTDTELAEFGILTGKISIADPDDEAEDVGVYHFNAERPR